MEEIGTFYNLHHGTISVHSWINETVSDLQPLLQTRLKEREDDLNLESIYHDTAGWLISSSRLSMSPSIVTE
jgi:hypothetical protein